MPSEIQRLLERPFQVVAGKGGVGRTLVASAIALRSAERGARTLLLEVNSADSGADRLGVPDSVDDPRQVLDNLWLCRMTPRGSMREYALMVLRFKALYALVFENKLVKYLLRSIPSLAEFTMLGKTWYHAMETLESGAPRYERIIVDAPATGHAITFLSVARTVADITPEGIMRTASGKMADLVEGKDTSCLHVVCTPEEMPVNEGLEIVSAARTRLRMPLGLAVVNRMLEPLLGANERPVFERIEGRASKDADIAAYALAARRRLDREAQQEAYASRFVSESRMPEVRIPELTSPPTDRASVQRVAACFEERRG
jgi:hypothetical protein